MKYLTKRHRSLDNKGMGKIGPKMAACLVLAALVSSVVPFYVSAENTQLSDQQIEQIKTNCVSVKNRLSQLHTNDTLRRVSSGRVYDYLLNKLMINFNNRLTRNGFGSASFSSASLSYESTLNAFRTNYILYENKLSQLISYDCSNNPSGFYDSIATVREYRQKIHNDIIEMNKYIDQYRSLVEKLNDDFKAAVKEITQ